jgi:hypothetical protein
MSFISLIARLFGFRPAASSATLPQPSTMSPAHIAPPLQRALPSGRPAARPAHGLTAGASEQDYVGIVGFNGRAFPVLLPTPISDSGVVGRIRQLATPNRFRGGCTNLSAGLVLGLDWLARWRRIRRIVVVSDGEPNVDTHLLADLAARARAERVSLCAIHIGDGANNPLRDLARATVGGWFESVGSFVALGEAMHRAGEVDRGGNQRRAVIVLLVDLSGSMATYFPGAPGAGRRIDALVAAVLAWRDYHGRSYNQFLQVA